MAEERKTPYSVFNYLVELKDPNGGDSNSVNAGFSEVSGLNAEVTIAEYRRGNSQTNYVNKFLGLNKSGDVTLKRGVIGASNIYDWLEEVRNGNVEKAKRDIEVKLRSEDRKKTVLTWKLRAAMPIKWTGPTLTAKGGSDVAMEELVLSVESIEQS